jgi:Leucine-rich repeat (LRR) protein
VYTPAPPSQGLACLLKLKPVTCVLWRAGPALPHLTGCGAAVASIASLAPQLRSLTLSRYDVGSVACVTSASQLTSLALLHCSLRDSGLKGLASLRRLQKLELNDNNITCAGLGKVARLAQLVSVAACVGPVWEG